MEKRRNHSNFKFKEFEISHQYSTLAVGTDAILLASFINRPHAKTILDVGTGCGIIALALAQKSDPDTKIHAIDIDESSIIECKNNFKISPWNEQLEAEYINFLEFPKNNYDIIVSNPPYFRDALLNPDLYKQKARHQDDFDMNQFAEFCFNSSSPIGLVYLIYPYNDLDYLITVFENQKLFVNKLLNIHSKKSKEANRVVLEFGKNRTLSKSETLIIYTEDNQYTSEYKDFTKSYYLNF
jgi:tRNA1Val (adenine37-N6)-methyltransferase